MHLLNHKKLSGLSVPVDDENQVLIDDILTENTTKGRFLR